MLVTSVLEAERQEDREFIILDYIASKLKANFGDMRPCLETQKQTKQKTKNNKMASRPLSHEGRGHIHVPWGRFLCGRRSQVHAAEGEVITVMAGQKSEPET